MCGIVGILARNASVAPDILERATRSLAHRGPDDSGTIIFRETQPEPVEIGLGNRRLAILDLSPLGHQPMQDPETGNWIVYNGEIYNFREIRTRLQSEGTRFAGHSDTEVLLKAYGRWGERCLAEFRGMFAFGIWDARRHRLFMARDPMGIKPLYYYASDQHFLFASEVRTLLSTGLVPRRLAPAGLSNYLAFGSVYDPNTLIAGISAVRAGHYLIWERGSTREVEYWDLARFSRAQEEASSRSHPNGHASRMQLEELRAALEESARMQVVSDVPVGIFLSGGIDSSSLVALLGAGAKTVSTFSIVFREADYSEAEFSRAVAGKFSTEHHEIMVSQHDALEAIPHAVQAMDQPTIDGLNTYLVSRQARAAGMKVALTGLGGDELFAGYSSFRTVPQMERLTRLMRWVPSIARKPLATAFTHFAPNTDQNRKLSALAHDNGNVIHPYFLSRMLFTAEQRKNLFASHHEETAANAPLHAALERARNFDPINRVSYLEARCYMLNTLLRDADFMSMAQGFEVRVPLIDHRLAEQLFAMPGAWKLDGVGPKPLLVGALGSALPEKIVHRPKRGFTLPFEHWLRDELRSDIEDTLHRTSEGPLGCVLDFDAVCQVWASFQRGATSWSRPWSLCVLQRWCELHL